jgi:hypothetical protein
VGWSDAAAAAAAGFGACLLVAAIVVAAGPRGTMILRPGEWVRPTTLPWGCQSIGAVGQEVDIACNARFGPTVILKSNVQGIYVISSRRPAVVDTGPKRRAWVFSIARPVAPTLVGHGRVLTRGEALTFLGLPSWRCTYPQAFAVFTCNRANDSLTVAPHTLRITTPRPLRVTQLPRKDRLYSWRS